MIMSLPGVLEAGTTYDKPVSTLDILPTTLAAAGLEYPFDKKLDGVNLLPYLSGENTGKPHETLYWKRGYVAAVRKGPWKYITIEGRDNVLYNLDEDPGETRNVVLLHSEVAEDLENELQIWEDTLAPSRWGEGDYWENHRRDRQTHKPEQPSRKTE